MLGTQIESLSKLNIDLRVIILSNLLTCHSQWNTTFGTTPQSSAPPPQQTPLKLPVSGAQEIPTLPEMQSLPNTSMPQGSQAVIPPQQYSGAPIPSFVSPSMWQESVASVYEGGLKRHATWDYDENNMVNSSKRPR